MQSKGKNEMNSRFMICYAFHTESSQVQTEYYENFESAVMKYTVLCSNCHDVVLADTVERKILRHFSYRHSVDGVSVSAF